MARVPRAAGILAVASLLLLAGCTHPSRDPTKEPLPAGKGAMLANIVTEEGQHRMEGVGVIVEPFGGYGVSDAQGHVVLVLSPGHYKATASKSGWEGAPREFDVVAGEYEDVPIFMSPLSNT